MSDGMQAVGTVAIGLFALTLLWIRSTKERMSHAGDGLMFAAILLAGITFWRILAQTGAVGQLEARIYNGVTAAGFLAVMWLRLWLAGVRWPASRYAVFASLGMAALFALSVLFPAVNPQPRSARADNVGCKSFSTQAEAQAFFEASGPGDPFHLDGDRDGVACERLK